jgi:hypothetical protein
MKEIVAFSLIALTAAMAQAQTSETPVASSAGSTHFFVGLDAGGGGNTLADVPYTNGSSQAIKAGGGVQFKGGIEYRFTPSVAMRGSLGYEVDTTHATNGSVTFSRWPLEVIALWSASEKIRVGAGVRKVTSAKLESDGVASSVGNHSYDSDPGLVLEAEYLLGSHAGISLRAMSDKYTYQGKSIDGNHVAVGVNWYF